MFKIIAVTNRHICRGDFYERIREIAACGTDVILREKDMSRDEYDALLSAVESPEIIPHSFIDVAEGHNSKRLHLPLHMLESDPDAAKKFIVGVSVHSPEEAARAQLLGAKYITAGHIFATDCKKGLPGRGLDYIKRVKAAVDIPVYAIGGINAGNIASVREAGADGACVMSGLMCCDDVKESIDVLYRN
jgi:thiamine-phosphate pyrophosphorylase